MEPGLSRVALAFFQLQRLRLALHHRHLDGVLGVQHEARRDVGVAEEDDLSLGIVGEDLVGVVDREDVGVFVERRAVADVQLVGDGDRAELHLLDVAQLVGVRRSVVQRAAASAGWLKLEPSSSSATTLSWLPRTT